MGEVWRAHDRVIDRIVAVKLLTLATDEDRERSGREARALGRLSHPNVATVFDYGDPVDGEPGFIAMELVDGIPLSKLIETGPLPTSEVMSVGAQIADGLQAAHEQGVIHRDVKPANVIVAPDGHATMIDFGIADSGQATDPDAHLGTLPYAAPERLAGGSPGVAADTYSLGVVLYEALTGHKPSAPSEPARTQRLGPGAGSPQPMDLIRRMLSADPEDRPTMKTVAAELRQGGGDMTVPLGTGLFPPEPTVATGTGGSWRPWILAAAAVVIVALALLLSMGTSPDRTTSSRSPSPSQPAVPKATVPNVAGMSVSDAEARLAERDLKVGTVNGEGDTVAWTDPPRGARIRDGSTVDLYLQPTQTSGGSVTTGNGGNGPPPWANNDHGGD